MSDPELDAILPWRKANDLSIAYALRRIRSGKWDIISATILVPYIRDPTLPAWKRLERSLVERIPRPLLRGCDTEEEILENIHDCMRGALSSKEYDYAMWILYLAERERIPLMDQRYWRQLDQVISEIPLEGDITALAAVFATDVFTALSQRPLMFEYIHRLINEKRWELLIRVFRISTASHYAYTLHGVPSVVVLEILERSPSEYLTNWIKENIRNLRPHH